MALKETLKVDRLFGLAEEIGAKVLNSSLQVEEDLGVKLGRAAYSEKTKGWYITAEKNGARINIGCGSGPEKLMSACGAWNVKLMRRTEEYIDPQGNVHPVGKRTFKAFAVTVEDE